MKWNKYVLAACLGMAVVAQAQTAPAKSAVMAAGDFAQGEVRKVDKENAKVTLRHGEIPALDMPPMTMVFTVRDRSLLDHVKAGDKVRFRAANESGTLYLIEVKANP